MSPAKRTGWFQGLRRGTSRNRGEAAAKRPLSPVLGVQWLEERAMLSATALDATFGTGGIVSTPIGGSTANDELLGAAIESDGKIVAAGGTIESSGKTDIALLRYNTDGSLDTSFGTGGIVVTSLSASTLAEKVTIEANGTIVVGGYIVDTNGDDFLVARYTANGKLDTSFGNGAGYVTTKLGTSSVVDALAVQSDGKIVAGGYGTNNGVVEFGLARYNTDGTLDTSFGGGGTGFNVTSFGGNTANMTSLAIDSNGDIVGGGWEGSSGSSLAVARYTSAGVLDTSFGAGGATTTSISGSDAIESIAIDPQGNIVFGGYVSPSNSEHFLVGRYTSSGALDTSFDGIGYTATEIGDQDSIDSIAIAANGQIVAAGAAALGDGSALAVARYDSNGQIDSYFSGGAFTQAVGTGSVLVSSVLIDPNNRIVALGTDQGSSTGTDFFAARFGGTFNQEGNTLYVDGTADDDQFMLSFSDAGDFAIGVNGVSQPFVLGSGSGQVNDVIFYGGLGSDTSIVNDPYNTEFVSVEPDTLASMATGFALQTLNSENNYFYGIAADTAELTDTSGTNLLVNTSTFSSFSGSDYYNQVAGVATVYAYSASGTSDTAYFYSTSGATFVATPTYSYLSATGIAQWADGFANVVVESAGDGSDLAYLYGSTGTDTFVSTPSFASLSGSVSGTSFANTAYGFAAITAFAGGGTETAYLYDQDGGSSTLVATQTYTTMTGSGYSDEVVGFSSVLGIGSTNNTDIAYLYDTDGNNSLYTGGGYASLVVGSTVTSTTGMSQTVVVNQGTDDDVESGDPVSMSIEYIGAWA